MKKYFSNIFALAALLMAGAAFTACSSDDNIDQPANPVGEKTYTLTINASKGANASTRALKLETSGALTAYWENGDVLSVFNVTKNAALTGSLTASNASGSTATFSGALTGTIEKNDVLVLSYHQPTGMSDYSAQEGTLASAATRDYATATVTVESVNAGEITISETSASFQTKTAMLKLTLRDNATPTPNPLNATQLKISATMTVASLPMTEDIATFTLPEATYTANGGDGILYFALPDQATVAAALATKIQLTVPSVTTDAVATALGGATLTYTATVGGNTYTATKTGYNFVGGKYYAGTLTMAPAPVVTDLSSISGAYTAQNGETLTGTLGKTVKISIADGATVTIAGVDINTNTTLSSGNYAGITCLGTATIILKDGTTNYVRALNNGYPGIYVPVGHTLTIQGETLGTGILNATGRGSTAGAGIGAASESTDIYRSCGNIVIAGGVINARTGSERAAGIGCGGSTNPGSSNPSTCGTITITGGTITATGGKWAPGIGGGYDGDCGDITIANTVTSVTATKGDKSSYLATSFDCIGRGREGTCGTVKFGNQTMYNGSSWTTTPTSGNTYGGLSLTISQTTYDADTWTLTPVLP